MKQEIKELQNCMAYINAKFPGNESLKRKKNREQISGSFSRDVVKYLAQHASGVEKIFYGNGCNAYRFYAPEGFSGLVEKAMHGYANLDRQLAVKPATKRLNKI